MNRPVTVWFVFMASSALWLPGYHGTVRTSAADAIPLLALYGFLGLLALLAVGERAPSPRRALVAALPSLGLLMLSPE